MNTKIVAGLSAALFAAVLFSTPSQASCDNSNSCSTVLLKKKKIKTQAALAVPKAKLRKKSTAGTAKASGGTVVALIKGMAPRYGVPTWFALRIAKVESNYNPRARGAAGELGVFQLKCSTAKGLGFRGSCAGLLDARTNVTYGLKHLSLAVKSSRGNLKLAASKHNGGLGRKTLVKRYVNLVF
jgi:soluble lytic murein transglycosylase-like protein